MRLLYEAIESLARAPGGLAVLQYCALELAITLHAAHIACLAGGNLRIWEFTHCPRPASIAGD